MDTLLVQMQAFAEIISAVGITGILIFLVAAFYRGDLVSKPVLDRILDRFWGELNTRLKNIEDKLDTKIAPRGW